jgi:hypothetical protein
MKLQKLFNERLAAKQNVIVATPGMLGDDQGTVMVPGEPGMVYVRVNGDVTVAENHQASDGYGTPVWVGYDPKAPGQLQVLDYQHTLQTYGGIPANRVGRHGFFHEFPENDMVNVHLQQFKPLRVLPAAAGVYNISIEQGIVKIGEVWVLIAAQTTDLYAYAPLTDGYECMVLISVSSAGAIVFTKGAEYNRLVGLVDIPAAPAGTIAELAAVRLYFGQLEIFVGRSGSDIVDLRFPGNYGDFRLPLGHHTTHELGGADEVDLHGLPGQWDEPFASVGDLIYGAHNPIGKANVDRAGLEILSQGSSSELLIGDCDLTLDPILAVSAIDVTINLWISQYWYGSGKSTTVRLRRDDLSGAVLDSHTFTAPAGDSNDGHQEQWSTTYNDAAPTSRRYVLTVQANNAANTVHSDTREFDLAGTDAEVHAAVLPYVADGKIIKGTSGAPAWGDEAGGTGDVVGPGAAVDGNFAGFDTTTGKKIKDLGYKPADFAPAAKGVTGGDSHDHTGGHGAQIAYGGLSGLPTLGTAAAKNIPAAGNASVTEVVYGTDTRLTDARTPAAHTHTLLKAAADGTTAIQLQNAAGSALVTVDTTNGRMGVGVTPSNRMHVHESVDGVTAIQIANPSTGTSAIARFYLTNNVHGASLQLLGSNHSITAWADKVLLGAGNSLGVVLNSATTIQMDNGSAATKFLFDMVNARATIGGGNAPIGPLTVHVASDVNLNIGPYNSNTGVYLSATNDDNNAVDDIFYFAQHHRFYAGDLSIGTQTPFTKFSVLNTYGECFYFEGEATTGGATWTTIRSGIKTCSLFVSAVESATVANRLSASFVLIDDASSQIIRTTNPTEGVSLKITTGGDLQYQKLGTANVKFCLWVLANRVRA